MQSELAKKWNIVEFLPETVQLNDEKQLSRVERALAKFDKGPLYTAVLTCQGLKKCPYKSDCPIPESVDAVVGSKCPLERLQQEKWFEQYCQAFNIQPSDWARIADVRQLVALDLQIMRANQIIASEGFEQVQVTRTDEGETFEKRLHNVAQLLDKLETRRVKLLQSMDRSGVQLERQDPSSYIALLKRKFKGEG